MSGLAQLSYVTAVWSPGRWGVMYSSQFSHIIQKYTGHIHEGLYTYLMVFLKFHYWKWSLLAWDLNVGGGGQIIHNFPSFTFQLLASLINFKFSNLKHKNILWVKTTLWSKFFISNNKKKKYFSTFVSVFPVAVAVAAAMNGWLFEGPCDDSPGAHQFTEAPGTSGQG